MRMVVLLGAGASIPAEMPSTGELTDRVLSFSAGRGTDSNYYLGLAREANRNGYYLALVGAVIRHLRDDAETFYADWGDRAVNYEDLAYMAGQVHDSVMGEFENPAIRVLQDDVRRIAVHHLGPVHTWMAEETLLAEAAREAVHYIECVVSQSLSRRPVDTQYLAAVGDAVADASVERVDFATLNHDLVLEEHLVGRGIPYVDGFGPKEGSVRRWDSSRLASGENGPLLLKLHGSVDWCYYGQLGLCRTADLDYYHVTDEGGSIAKDAFGWGSPRLLCGVFNKMYEYLRAPFFDLQVVFRDKLAQADCALVVGYGFGDKGINTRLSEWLFGRRDRHICVVHPHPLGLIRGARGVVSKNWRELVRAGQVSCVRAGIEATDWPTVRAKLPA
jgi:hypothetical protein